jgi:hypothetical protein
MTAATGPLPEPDWARVKRQQAHEFDSCANVASGIGEYGAANACWRVAGILRAQAAEIEAAKAKTEARP